MEQRNRRRAIPRHPSTVRPLQVAVYGSASGISGRDRLIHAYLGHVRRLALKACPASSRAVEAADGQHLLGKLPLGEKLA